MKNVDTAPLASSAKEAREAGGSYYFTGKPCSHGHVCKRRVSGVCIECEKISSRSRVAKYLSTDKGRATQKRYREKNKETRNKKNRERYKSDPEKHRMEVRISYKKHAEKRRQATKDWNKNNKQKKASGHRRRTYGISDDDYNRIFESQGRKCPICGTSSPVSKVNPWHIDHCHKTGVVRGILCQKCNSALGGFNDDPQILMSAITYLSKPSAKAITE